ncbi:DUF1285 domain-containing protein [Rheinheimera sp. MM224]|uniref:DUF1285 domain-containing protein n=1 Tax=Rheinheimera sp. MM224 TaxID=3019969 RepID=UPI0021F91D55|nr:DUF1285 domain-containing protein [Rheinheimera sp. MM224]CAI3806054.1 hypothetical protein JAMGFMIE_04052 [Rheinheimera sp. MM224]
MDLKQLQLSLQQPHLAPVELWDPAFCGDIPIRIDRHGDWYYLDSKIQRPQLVQLFASVLTRQQQEYFLLTPVEKVRIQVEDAAFVIVAIEQQRSDAGPVLIATTNLSEQVLIDTEYPLFLQAQPDGQLLPYLQLWRGLTAKFSRAVYYQLVDLAFPVQVDGKNRLQISSAGVHFELGTLD